MWEQKLSIYDKLAAMCPRFERRGKTVPYASPGIQENLASAQNVMPSLRKVSSFAQIDNFLSR